MGKTYVIIHGHFYQPPRENPWTGAIEVQDSAAPYHDWNQRVAAECYTPNSRSRVLDGQGRVLEVTNNYEHISYNFGPTLLSWLEDELPETYERILAADRKSAKARGHGNAMAQVYNHVIMPLASARDRWTQIQWGLADFRTRFGRDAQGIWLSETAVNEAVMEDLGRAGIRFIILAPSQADLIRAPGEEAWRDVGAGDIPIGRAYRHVTGHGEVAVLFYDGEASKAVAFEHVLRNASTFADRIARSAAEGLPDDEPGDRLAIVATDGESYGHHEPMGDMCLSYLATRELPARNLILTNPAAYLDDHPPTWEVRLKPGGRKLGTAWSCAHGVGRWMEDCGCTTGGPPSWNQAWRGPLREAFDKLRERMDPLFEQEGNQFLENPWAARDDYIEVILGRQVGASRGFLEKHAKRELTDLEHAQVYRLMEMERHGMLMYTSCAWFFADLSGIESVQNLAYFARAAQLGELVAGHPITTDSLDHLAEAKSNLAPMGSGRDLLRRFVRPTMLSPAKVAAHQAVRALLDGQTAGDRLYGFRVEIHAEQRGNAAGTDAFRARMTVRADRTAEGGTFDVAVLAGSRLQLRAFVRDFDPQAERVPVDELLAEVTSSGFEAACDRFEELFGQSLGLPDMLQELRLAAMGKLLQPVLEELGQTFDALYKRHEGLLHSLVPLGVGLPKALSPPVGYAASRRLDRLVERGLPEGDLTAARELASLAQSLGVPLDRRRASRRIERTLADRLARALQAPEQGELAEIRLLIEAARAMQLTPDEARLQDAVAEHLQPGLDTLLDPDQPGGARLETAKALVELAGHLNLNVDDALARLAEPDGR